MKNNFDIICVGEVLIDFIGHQDGTFVQTKDYHRFLGGSPTNVAVNATRLGLKVALVATCGNDGFGEYIKEKLIQNNVLTSNIKLLENKSTSVIFISKSKETPDFIPFRAADSQIFESQLPNELLSNAKIFHTTCFALSENPARSTILNRAQKAKTLGLQLSIDINFSEKIWSNRLEAFDVLKKYLALNPLVKVSEDDCLRLFESRKSDAFILDFFNSLGAETICLTKGKNGVTLFDKNEGMIFQDSLKIDNIKDTTGAGDAFWAGFLYAKLNQKSLNECVSIAQKLASIKLQSVGRLPENRDIIAEIL